MSKTKFIIEGVEKRDYIVKKFGKNSAHIILPKETLDKKISVVFIEDII